MDSELDELLREQEAFTKGRKEAAAKLVRVARPEEDPTEPTDVGHGYPSPSPLLGASEEGGKGEKVGKKRAPSLFKQLRQGLAGQGTGNAPLRPFGVATSSPAHPEITALPDVDAGASAAEELSCLAEIVKERPPISPLGGGGCEVLDAPAAGFPTPTHRSVGKFLGKSQQRVGQPPPSGPGLGGPGQSASGRPQSVEEEIDEQNRQALSSATPEEIHEWQQQLVQQFGQDTCDFFKKRGKKKQQRARDASPGRPAARKNDADGPEGCSKGSTGDGASGADVAPMTVGISFHQPGDDASGMLDATVGPCADPALAMQSLAGGCLNPQEMQKLQWTMPAGKPDFDAVVDDASLPPEGSGKVVQLLRFDFHGRVCIRSDGDDNDDEQDGMASFQGLHHHGAESSQAGYTLAELLILSRSTNMPQRALALRTLATVLERCRVPVRRGLLGRDPALKMAGGFPDDDQSPPQAGFGLGLCVFFWHGLARSDIAKHIAEALNDKALPVQVAGLRCLSAFFHGAPIGFSAAGAREDEDAEDGVFRPVLGQHSDGRMPGIGSLPLERVLASPFHAARELVYPEAPPPFAGLLAQRTRVAVVTEEGAGGGGTSAWSYLLRRCLLGAKQEAEVSGADVLEPFLASRSRSDEIAPFVPLVDGVIRCLPGIGEDHVLLASAVGALCAACVWSTLLCHRVLEAITPMRAHLLEKAADTSGPAGAAELRFEVLRLLRCSCEVGGRTAVQWWLAAGKSADEDGATAPTWTAQAVIRKAVLESVCRDSVQGAEGDAQAAVSDLCAIQGVYVWLAWLQCGAGVDSLGSWASSLSTFWHKVAAGTGAESDAGRDREWVLVALTLRLAVQLAATADIGAGPTSPLPPLQAAADAAKPLEGGSIPGGGLTAMAVGALGPLVSALSNATASGKGCNHPGRELALASAACLATQLRLVPKAAAAGCRLLAAQREAASSDNILPALPLRAPGAPRPLSVDDEEAPWPLGGAACGERLWRLARIGALRALCDLAGVLQDADAFNWVRRVKQAASARVAEVAGPLPSAFDTSDDQVLSELLVGPSQQDPWAALLSSACRSLAADDREDEGAIEHPLGQAVAAQSLTIAGCWPTARGLLAAVGVRFGPAACDAVLRAAFRPEAPWTVVRKDIAARTARATGRAPPAILSQVLPPPLALGAPSLGFAPAAFWALAGGPHPEAARQLLEVLSGPKGAMLAQASPPWLPFVAVASLIGSPLGRDPKSAPSTGLASAESAEAAHDHDCASWAWSDVKLQPLLEAYCKVHFKAADPSTWLRAESPWMTEVLRGLCERIAIVFQEDSYGNALVARVLWGFAARAMPTECRDVCWGGQDVALPALFARALRVRDVGGEDQDGLLWPLRFFMGEEAEPEKFLRHAEHALRAEAAPSWPVLLLQHHAATRAGRRSPLAVTEALPQGQLPGAELPQRQCTLDEME